MEVDSTGQVTSAVAAAGASSGPTINDWNAMLQRLHDLNAEMTRLKERSNAPVPTPVLKSDSKVPKDAEAYAAVFRDWTDRFKVADADAVYSFRDAVKDVEEGQDWVDSWIKERHGAPLVLAELLSAFANHFDPKQFRPNKKAKTEGTQANRPIPASMEERRKMNKSEVEAAVKVAPNEPSGTANPLEAGKLLTFAEKLTWMNTGRCFKCGGVGHKSDACGSKGVGEGKKQK